MSDNNNVYCNNCIYHINRHKKNSDTCSAHPYLHVTPMEESTKFKLCVEVNTHNDCTKYLNFNDIKNPVLCSTCRFYNEYTWWRSCLKYDNNADFDNPLPANRDYKCIGWEERISLITKIKNLFK